MKTITKKSNVWEKVNLTKVPTTATDNNNKEEDQAAATTRRVAGVD